MKRTVLVEFQITAEITDWSQYRLSCYLADQLSISIMLKDLNVNHIKIGGYTFDLEARRKRNRRSSFQ
jgi:hypothetical protein